MSKIIKRVLGALAVSTVLFIGAGGGVASAQSSSECDISAGLQAYLECVAGQNGEPGGEDGDGTTSGEAGTEAVAVRVTDAQTLPRTGSDVGSMVGIGSALVLLGGATVYGVRQRRQSTDS